MGDDALRIMRMARFASELGFEPEKDTFEAAKAAVPGLADISPERIREELDRILLSDAKYGIPGGPYRGLELLDNLEAIDVIMPELAKGRGIAQKPQYHKYDVLHHCFHAVDCIEPSLTLAPWPLCSTTWASRRRWRPRAACIPTTHWARILPGEYWKG